MKESLNLPFYLFYAVCVSSLMAFQYIEGGGISLGANLFYFLLLPFLRRFYAKARDDRKKLIEKIYTDRRTGLPNRERLRLDVLRRPVVLILINIDSFKEVNDFYGNPVGDVVILALAERLKALLGRNPSGLLNSARLYKLETDEFGILVDRSAAGRIREIAEEVAVTVHDEPFRVQTSDVTIHISQGISSAETGKALPGILAQADMALKRAKDKRVPFLVYDHSMDIHKEFEENIRWTHRVKQAILEDRVVPYYQPIVNNRTGKVEKYECLMRIIDPEEVVVYPEKFLKISKRSRLYTSLTRLMTSKVLEEMEKTGLDYNINISVEDIQNRETFAHIRRLLESHRQAASRLCFEILESESIENVPELPAFLKMIKRYGCSIALDDFGTGYSNFHYIMKLEPDYIKIDSSIVRYLDQDANAVTIAETLVDFARRSGIRTVAEYVHSEEILRIVRSLGIDYSQGYHLGRPRPSSEGGESLIPGAAGSYSTR